MEFGTGKASRRIPEGAVIIDLTEDSGDEAVMNAGDNGEDFGSGLGGDGQKIKEEPKEKDNTTSISPRVPPTYIHPTGDAGNEEASSTAEKSGEKPQVAKANTRAKVDKKRKQALLQGLKKREAEQSAASAAKNATTDSSANPSSPPDPTPASTSELVVSKDSATSKIKTQDGLPCLDSSAEDHGQQQPDVEITEPWDPLQNWNSGVERTCGGDVDLVGLVAVQSAKKTKAPKRASKKKGHQDAKKSPVADEGARVTKKQASKKKKAKAVPNQTIGFSSLLTADVIRDTAAHGGQEALPAVQITHRHLALTRLVKSLPADEQAGARSDKRVIEDACKEFGANGRSTIRVVTGGNETRFSLKGMESTLPAHQLIGAAFMRKREKGEFAPRGGLCADAMGLGKTVEMLANIVEGNKYRNDGGPKTTLIVATAALVNQWGSEIRRHCGDAMRVIYWTPKNKPKAGDEAELLTSFDIVLTTYDEVRKSNPQAEYPAELQTLDEKHRWWVDFFEANRGTLHEIEFLRVVLDEAQAIKNHASKTSIACSKLNAVHRWALSGTPIQNSVHELYAYFRFLGVMHCTTYRIFVTNYVGSDKQASQTGTERLRQMLSSFLIRRTHADRILGHPIVVLPPAHRNINWCRFNAVERAVYELVRSRMIQHINRLSRSNRLDANYSHILTLLLKLRQLTGHLLMLQRPMHDLLRPEDVEKIKDLAMQQNSRGMEAERAREIAIYRERLAREAARPKDEPKGEADTERRTETGESLFVGRESVAPAEDEWLIPDPDNIGRLHGIRFDFSRYLKTLHKGPQAHGPMETAALPVCVSCQEIAQHPMITSCYHIYCEECLEKLQTDAMARCQDNAHCAECSLVFTKARVFTSFFEGEGPAGEEAEYLSDDEGLRRERRGADARPCDWIDQEGANILPSAKTIAIKAQILNWMTENPEVKVIIFTQFKNMIRILAKVCAAEGWSSALYHGGMTLAAREQAIERFKTPDTQILLASLKAGGIGLNLTMAQRVIIVDPWWNSSVEQQAFCRVFRIGQTQETSWTRFLVEGTVDQNILDMQERKEAEIDSVMGVRAPMLSPVELLQLFGGVEVGGDGQPYIIPTESETYPNRLVDTEYMDDEF